MTDGYVADYYNHLDGLAGDHYDSSWRPSPIPVFKYSEDQPWDTGLVYVKYLHFKQRDSDSVRRLQFRLKGHTEAQTRNLVVDGNYGPATVEAVKHWQHKCAEIGVRDGKSVPKHQAKRILGNSYRIR